MSAKHKLNFAHTKTAYRDGFRRSQGIRLQYELKLLIQHPWTISQLSEKLREFDIASCWNTIWRDLQILSEVWPVFEEGEQPVLYSIQKAEFIKFL
jgi:hypothetical protein